MYGVHQVDIFPKYHTQAGSGSEKEQQCCPPSATSCLFSPLCWPGHWWWAALGNWAGVELTWQRNVFVIARGRRPEQGPGREGGRALGSTASLQRCLRRYSLGSLKFEGLWLSGWLLWVFQHRSKFRRLSFFTAYGLIMLLHWLFKKK